jgi:hypothetical protein
MPSLSVSRLCPLGTRCTRKKARLPETGWRVVSLPAFETSTGTETLPSELPISSRL